MTSIINYFLQQTYSQQYVQREKLESDGFKYTFLRRQDQVLATLCCAGTFGITETVYIDIKAGIAPDKSIWLVQGPLPSIVICCEHGYLIAEGWARGEVGRLSSRSPDQRTDFDARLNRKDNAAEYIYDWRRGPNSGNRQENWYIDGVFLPQFDKFEKRGEAGVAEYLSEYPEHLRLIRMYLRENFPSGMLGRALEATEIFRK